MMDTKIPVDSQIQMEGVDVFKVLSGLTVRPLRHFFYQELLCPAEGAPAQCIARQLGGRGGARAGSRTVAALALETTGFL